MRITADTNILVRAITDDDPPQSRLARKVLAEAELVALPLPVLCETVWVLAKGYGVGAVEIAATLRRPDGPHLSLADIDRIAAEGWAGKR